MLSFHKGIFFICRYADKGLDRHRSRTTLEPTPQMEFTDGGYGLRLWSSQNTAHNNHVQRMRKISDIRGVSPRMRSDTVFSTMSFLEIESMEFIKRARAESLLSVITSDSGNVDFCASSQRYDTLADMMTTKEEAEIGGVRIC